MLLFYVIKLLSGALGGLRSAMVALPESIDLIIYRLHELCLCIKRQLIEIFLITLLVFLALFYLTLCMARLCYN